MMRGLCMPALLACLFMPLASHADGPAVGVTHVWIREAPPGVRVLAGYFTLENLTDKPLTLITASSPDFGSVMLHRSVEHNGMDSMETLDKLVIPAHKNIVFAPGGYHLMLMQPHKRYYDGDLISVTLAFSDHSSLTILAPVRRDAPRN